MSYTLDIEAIIRKKQLATHFQPLVSIRRGMVIGYEALSRGLAGDNEIVIPPDTLFTLAERYDMSLELDRACRERAFANFAPLHARNKDMLLFVNVDASLLTSNVVGSGHIEALSNTLNVHPGNVVIEIIESHVQDTASLMRFIHRYRQLGFLIALDDVGAGHSNLERIASIKPEVIKIDRFLISNIHQEFYKQEVVNALTALARRIGAMTVAEGVECEEEAVYLMGAGADVLQGFHFARPALMEDLPDTSDTIRNVATAYRGHSLRMFEHRKAQQAQHREIIRRVRDHIRHVAVEKLSDVLHEQLLTYPHLECLYVLDATGMQISETVCNPFRLDENKRFVYQPARKGTDHSLKEYFMPIQAGLEECVTAPYISLASGNRCLTLASRYTSMDGEGYVLCLDVTEPDAMEEGQTMACAC